MKRHHYIGRWTWQTEQVDGPLGPVTVGFHSPPVPGAAALDLRPRPNQASQIDGSGWGIFSYRAPVSHPQLEPIGSGLPSEVSPAGRALMAFRAAVPGIAAASLDRMCLLALTEHADPQGLSAPKPIDVDRGMPGRCSLRIGQVRRRFRTPAGHWSQLRDRLRADFSREWLADTGEREHARRVLDYLRKRYRVHWQQLLDPAIAGDVPGPLNHRTSVSEDFNRADEDPITGWTVQVAVADSTVEIVSNACQLTQLFRSPCAHYASALSGSDMTCAVTHTFESSANDNRCGTAVRSDLPSHAGRDSYCAYSKGGSTSSKLVKVVNGTTTDLDTDATILGALPHDYEMTVDGSDLTFDNVTEAVSLSATDTAITGNTHAGVWTCVQPGPSGRDMRFDDWSAEDLDAGGAPTRSRIVLPASLKTSLATSL